MTPLALIVLGVPWLGHGRMTEAGLTAVAFLYGCLVLFTPDAIDQTHVTYGFPPWLVAGPVLVKSLISGSGLILNIRGAPWSKWLRFAGALIGSFIWLWFAGKLWALTSVGHIGFSFCIVSAIGSIRIMTLALLDLPRPGAPGVI